MLNILTVAQYLYRCGDMTSNIRGRVLRKSNCSDLKELIQNWLKSRKRQRDNNVRSPPKKYINFNFQSAGCYHEYQARVWSICGKSSYWGRDLFLTSSSCPVSSFYTVQCSFLSPSFSLSVSFSFSMVKVNTWPRVIPGDGESVWSGAFCNPNLCVCACVRMAAIERPMNSTWRSFHYSRLWSLNNTRYRDTFTAVRSSPQLSLRLRYSDLGPVSLQSFIRLVADGGQGLGLDLEPA